MHQDILALYSQILPGLNKGEEIFKLLIILKDIGASRVQAFFTLRDGCKFDEDEIDKAINGCNLWDKTNLTEDFYEVTLYSSNS
jgi:hypothetical protein